MKRTAAVVLLSLALVGGAHAAGSGSVSGSVVPNPLVVTMSLSSASVAVGAAVTATATARNLGVAGLTNVTLTLNGDPNLAVAGGAIRTIASIAGGGSAQVSWQFCALAPGGYVLLAKGTARTFTADSPAQVLNVSAGSTVCPEDASATLPAGGTLSTDREGDGATPADPVETSVTTPVAGAVSIDEGSASAGSTAYSFLGLQVQISAPAATAGNPLLLRFRFDASVLPARPVQVFRNGVALTGCPGDPCLAGRSVFPDGDLELTVRTSLASAWTFGSAIVTRGAVAGALQTSNRHAAAFAAASDGTRVAGTLAFDSYRVTSVTALAVAGRTAWFAGVGTEGRSFLAYVEDNGRGDVFKLWIAGVAQTTDGRLVRGDVRVMTQ
jgi:hypothetical protein